MDWFRLLDPRVPCERLRRPRRGRRQKVCVSLRERVDGRCVLGADVPGLAHAVLRSRALRQRHLLLPSVGEWTRLRQPRLSERVLAKRPMHEREYHGVPTNAVLQLPLRCSSLGSCLCSAAAF